MVNEGWAAPGEASLSQPARIPYLFIKIALEDVGPVTIAAARVLSGG